MPRKLITQAQAAKALDALNQGLVEAHMAAFGVWRSMTEEKPEWVLPLDSSERAQFLHAHLRYQVQVQTEKWLNVKPTKALEFFAVAVGPDILLRFKYMGRGAPSNYQTDQQKMLARQQYDEAMVEALALDDISGPLTLLTCGYRLALDDAAISSIVVRRDLLGHPPWEYPIYGQADGIVSPEPLPGMPEPEAAKVTSKRQAKKAREEGEAQ